jgi:hypothetical protein
MQDSTLHDRFSHNSRNIFLANSAVPDCLRVDHQGGSMLALIQAFRPIRTNLATQALFVQFDLKTLQQAFTSVWIATTSRVTGIACTAAHEDMVSECWHKIAYRIWCNYVCWFGDNVQRGKASIL